MPPIEVKTPSEKAQDELADFLQTHPDKVDLDIQVIADMYDRYRTQLAQHKYDRTILEVKMKLLERNIRTGKQATINPATNKPHARDLSEDLAYVDEEVVKLREQLTELEYEVEVFDGHCKAIEMKSNYLSGFQGRANRLLGMQDVAG